VGIDGQTPPLQRIATQKQARRETVDRQGSTAVIEPMSDSTRDSMSFPNHGFHTAREKQQYSARPAF